MQLSVSLRQARRCTILVFTDVLMFRVNWAHGQATWKILVQGGTH